MPTQIRKSAKPTAEARAELAEQQLAEALQALDHERQRAAAMEAKLRELNVPLDFLSVPPTAVSPNGDSTIQAIYTDGACSGNPGRGGWGTVIYFSDGSVHELGGFDPQTTNNRMEMQAAIAALEFLSMQQLTAPIPLYTDSEYLKNGITKWISGWKKKGWITSTGKPVLNQDLWQILDRLNTKQIDWRYVRGHAGNIGNERCDTIARTFAQGSQPQLQQRVN
jgi:ribonuclease HI